VTETPWAGADTDQLARLRTALAAERTVFAVMRSGLAIAGGGAVIVTLLGNRWPAPPRSRDRRRTNGHQPAVHGWASFTRVKVADPIHTGW
jgi:uncharacterized membrane protein YidH (DUF202 family)